MLNDGIIFGTLIFAVVFTLVLWKVGPQGLPAFFKSKDGKGIARGIILAPAVLFLIVLVATLLLPKSAAAADNPFSGGRWFNYAEVYAGADFTKKLSPQCEAGTATEAPATWALH